MEAISVANETLYAVAAVVVIVAGVFYILRRR